MIETLKAARTLLVDTNLLVLYLVGLLGSESLAAHKRTTSYTLEDFFLLGDILASKRRLVTTPHILSEVEQSVEAGARASTLAARDGAPGHSADRG